MTGFVQPTVSPYFLPSPTFPSFALPHPPDLSLPEGLQFPGYHFLFPHGVRVPCYNHASSTSEGRSFTSHGSWLYDGDYR